MAMFYRGFLVLGMLFSACHPFSMFQPRAIKPQVLAQEIPGQPSIAVAIDSYGIPFIKAATIDEALYGLGFMHARDRLFQLDLMRHAGQGRMSELFGERGLYYDKKLRILTYKLDEQMAVLNADENRILDSYVRGVNEGAKQRGRSAEHFLLGIQFEEFTKKDVVSIARLQTWQLASDLLAEITRLKIARAPSWSVDAKNEILKPINDRGSSILKTAFSPGPLTDMAWPDYLLPKILPIKNAHALEPEEIQTGDGASNGWAIEARMTNDNQAILMNDPHLMHSWPSNFYLATLEAGDYFVTGATFVGLPGILIGSSKRLAWGITASYLNTQDAVYLALDKEQKNTYIVDGKKMPFGEWPQSYCLGKNKKKCSQEMLYTTIYGPVINHDYEPWIEAQDALAVQWTGFSVEQHPYISFGFIELAKAHNVEQGVDAIKSMTLPGVNIILADTSGNIGYSYAGLVPKRHEPQHHSLPLDGKNSLSKWPGFFNRYDEPFVINPAAGYLITANQNIYSSDAGQAFSYGQQGAPPFRAMRIKERIDAAIRLNKLLDFDELAALQLDDMSLEAKDLAPLLGNVCEDRFNTKDNARKAFAQSIKNFDGRFTVNAQGALPYDILTKKILHLTMNDVLGKDIPDRVAYFGHIGFNIKDALHKELMGEKTAIFAAQKNTYGTIQGLVGKACEEAFKDIAKTKGKSPWQWRYGRHHYLQRQSLLAKAPLVGGFFKDKKREVAGTSNAPMAESGLPVIYGANLRFKAKMSNPPKLYAVLDSGNSGTVGDKNALDQADLWHQGKSILLTTDWEQAVKHASLQFSLPYVQ